MPKRKFTALDEFKANLHQEGATLVEYSGQKVPCILLAPAIYEEILSKSVGKRFSADTLLDIFYDGVDVFVDIQINFRERDSSGFYFEANYLFYANDMLEFFESLAESGMIAIAPVSDSYTNSKNVFMIQLPKREAADNALRIIKANAKTHPPNRNPAYR